MSRIVKLALQSDVAVQPAAAAGEVPSDPGCISEARPAVVSPIWRLVLPRISSITPFNDSGRDPPIFCVHAVSGEVTSFKELADALAPEQRFYGIQIPKADMKVAFVRTIPEIARRHVKALTAFQPAGPVVLAGWSAGAVIALEMATQLRAQGRDVPLLIAFDGAPCNTGAGISRSNPLYVLKLLYNIPGWVWSEFEQDGSLSIFLRRMRERFVLRTRTAFTKVQNEQTLDGRAVQRVLDFRGWSSEDKAFVLALHNATRAYVAKPYTGDVLVYEAKTHPRDHLTQIDAAWKHLAPHATIVRVRGNHVSMLRDHRVRKLAADLLRRMDCLHVCRDSDASSKD